MSEPGAGDALVIYDDPSTERTILHVVDGVVGLDLPEGHRALPSGALQAVFRRLGGELEGNPIDAARLELPSGESLQTFEFLARYDVMPRRWAVLNTPGSTPRAVLAVTLGAALRHLARAAHGAKDGSGQQENG